MAIPFKINLGLSTFLSSDLFVPFRPLGAAGDADADSAANGPIILRDDFWSKHPWGDKLFKTLPIPFSLDLPERTEATVITDLDDYAPGETATITATGFRPGSVITFEVDHVNGEGLDGVYGTLDDVTVQLGGDGHDAWRVRDGGRRDLDGERNGSVTTEWYVNPDDSANERFLLTATDRFNIATHTFTDGVPGARDANGVLAGVDLTYYDPDGPDPDMEPEGQYITYGGSGNQSSAVFTNDVFGAGTGVIDPFVRLQNNEVEQGVNTSGTTVYHEKAADFTRNLTLNEVAVFTTADDPNLPAGQFYQFRLDVNENSNNSGQQFISLDEIKIFVSSDPNLTFANPGGGAGGKLPLLDPDENDFIGATSGTSAQVVELVWDLDELTDTFVALNYDLQAGSGVGDIAMYINKADFDAAIAQVELDTGLTLNNSTTYVYLYSAFGYTAYVNDVPGGTDAPGTAFATDTEFVPTDFMATQPALWETSDGFEEWSILKGGSPATIVGFKREDINADGDDEGGTDPGVADWEVRLYIDDGDGVFEPGGDDLLLQTVDTADGVTDDLDGDGIIDPIGFYHFGLLGAGDYWIQEETQAGWTASNTTLFGPITLENGDIYGDDGTEPTTFLNYRDAFKTGTKYEDENADGVRDGGDNGLAGWTIVAFEDVDLSGTLSAGDTLFTSDVTDGNGDYSLTLTPGVQYIILEQVSDQSDWFESPDNGTSSVNTFNSDYGEYGYVITLDSNETESGNDFGNFQQATKTGRKYNDLNADGDDEAGGDPSLAGWTITAFVDANSDGILQQTEIDAGAADSDVTNAMGVYSLTLDPGDYIIVETEQATWFESPDDDTTEVNPLGLGSFGNYGYAITLTSGEVDSGNDFANYQQATKNGTKYEDENADGDRDAEDSGLAGWTIAAFVDVDLSGTLTAGDTLFTSDVTDANGDYSLTLNPGVQYIIVEQVSDQTDWFESPDNGTSSVNTFDNDYGEYGYVITLDSGEVENGNDFANYQQATKNGRKYNDLNADGDDEGGADPGLAGWTIAAFADANGDGILQQTEIDAGAADSDVTDGSGNYSLTLDPGKYIVVELLTAGWAESPDSDTTEVNPLGLGGYGNYGYAIDLSSGEVENNNDFGNYQAATKTGTKFHDLNADGVLDIGEGGLSGWEIRAYEDTNGNGVLDQAEFDADNDGAFQAMTNAMGVYSLSGLTPGQDYIIVEVMQTDWFQSFPTGTSVLAAGLDTSAGGVTLGANGYAINLESGEVESGNDFGNYQQATKEGTKYEDDNANGVRDAGDDGLSGWTITAFEDANGDGILQQTEIDAGAADSDVTDGSGNYSLTLNPGDFIIVETAQNNWFESPDADTTEVNPGELGGFGKYGYAITLDSQEVDSGNDFANYQQATKNGTKYEDENADGDRDAEDQGLAGWTIAAFVDVDLSGTLTAGDTLFDSDVTDGNGDYSLTLNPGVQYIIVEQVSDQTDWFESPDGGTSSVNTFDSDYGEYGYVITLDSGEVENGNDFANYQNGSVTGIKYHDLNADGDDEGGTDPRLQGWLIAAYRR